MRAMTMALLACEKENLLFVPGCQFAELDIFKGDLHWCTLMQLQTNEPGLESVVRIFSDLRNDHTIDHLDALVTMSDDVVAIPTVHIDMGEYFRAVSDLSQDLWFGLFCAYQCMLAAVGHDALITLAVDDAHIFGVFCDISLITTQHPLLSLDWEASILDAAVVVTELKIDFEFKICHLATFPNKKGVLGRGIVLSGFTNNRAIFNPPEAGIAIPARQSFAVENFDKFRLCQRCATCD